VGDGSPGSLEADGEGGEGLYIARSGSRFDLLVIPGGTGPHWILHRDGSSVSKIEVSSVAFVPMPVALSIPMRSTAYCGLRLGAFNVRHLRQFRVWELKSRPFSSVSRSPKDTRKAKTYQLPR
jgi:hypothetical protein